jgi:hypothetical protein
MRKISMVSLVLLMVLSTSISVLGATNFPDVPSGAWYEENVQVLVKENIISGYPDGSFKPNERISVEQFIKTMVVALGYDLENG